MTQALVDKLVSQVERHIHGRGRDEILQKLEQNPTADTVAEVTHTTIMDIDTQAAQRGAPLDIEVLLGVATEIIDMLIEIMDAMGIQAVADELREESLIKVALLHMKTVEGDPEQVAAAEEMLATLVQDGTMDMSLNHISEKASAEEGQMRAAGRQMAGPSRNPISAGVERGLMQGPPV